MTMATINHNLRPYLIGAAALAIVLLCVVIFRGCDNNPSYKEENKHVEQLQTLLRQAKSKAKEDSVRLAKHADSLRAAALDLQRKRDAIATELAVTKQQVQQLASANKQAKVDNDTARYIETCDSLREVAQVQAEVIEDYQRNDSLRTVNYEAQLSAKDSLLVKQAEFNAQLRATNEAVYDSYNNISKDYQKLNRKVKRERTLSRVLAVSALVAGGIILLK